MDPQGLLGHWGYWAIFGVVVLGNVGVPLPEETILVLAGYLVWAGELRLDLVLLIGILSAVLGDNVGYWIGRELGRPALERFGHLFLITRARLDAASAFVRRHGASAVFAARFLPGVRFLAGPVAGVTGLPPPVFIAANVCGAVLYVPGVVGIGYLVGLAFGDRLTALERVIGRVEHYGLLLTALLAAALAARRAWRWFRERGEE
jgi:membrane protein DedA with SNARE-associated domain